MIEYAGFTDIEENDNGTVNATKDGFRYFGLYVKDCRNEIEKTEAIESTTLNYV